MNDERPKLDYARPRNTELTGWAPIALWAIWGIVIVYLLRLVFVALGGG